MSVNPNRYRTMLLLEQVSAVFSVLSVSGHVKNIEQFETSVFETDDITVEYVRKVDTEGQPGFSTVAITIGKFVRDGVDHYLQFEQRYNYGVRREVVVKHICYAAGPLQVGKTTYDASVGRVTGGYIADLDRDTGEWLLDCVEEALGYMGDSIAYNLCMIEARSVVPSNNIRSLGTIGVV